MLRERYEKDKLFEAVASLRVQMEPELAQIDAILDDAKLFSLVKQDLERRYPKTKVTGRPSTPVEVILRMLVVKHLYGLSYRQTEYYTNDSMVLRLFTRLYYEQAPDSTTLVRWAKIIGPETLKAVNAEVTKIAASLKLTRGRKLRIDGTLVETNIHSPSDNSLLADGVRVLSRLIRRAKPLLEGEVAQVKAVFRDRTRSGKRLAREIASRSREGAERAKASYERLLAVTRASVRQAKVVLVHLGELGSSEAKGLADQLMVFVGRVEQVIRQTKRRVFEQEQVPAGEKLVSLFEPHTCIIKRGKAGKETEFGRKVWLDEVDGGLVSDWRLLPGNAPDQKQWRPSLDNHVRQFGKPPGQASADRGVYSPENEAYAWSLGVKRVILPQPGHKSKERCQYERQPWFQRGRHYHAGVEGRISVLKRKHKLGRCLNHGEEGLERWLGFGIIAANLAVIGRSLAKRAQARAV